MRSISNPDVGSLSQTKGGSLISDVALKTKDRMQILVLWTTYMAVYVNGMCIFVVFRSKIDDFALEENYYRQVIKHIPDQLTLRT
jgi:Cys-tRNA synthase (O-phospho-L-seryl-tRNA:Cys-tRNA synthase)